MRPAFNEIGTQLNSLSELREKPAGTIRITASEHAATTVLWPALRKLPPGYPDIHVELSIDSSLTDIVTERFDAGVRLGEALAKDMVAVRIGPDLRMVVVGSPAYFRQPPVPKTPHDLAAHRRINLRMLSSGSLYAWELEEDGRELRVQVEGQLAFNKVRFPGYHLYYPSRPPPSPCSSTSCAIALQPIEQRRIHRSRTAAERPPSGGRAASTPALSFPPEAAPRRG